MKIQKNKTKQSVYTVDLVVIKLPGKLLLSSQENTGVLLSGRVELCDTMSGFIKSITYQNLKQFETNFLIFLASCGFLCI